MVSVLAGLSAGIGSRADPVSASIRDAAPQGEREGREDAARRSAASSQTVAVTSGAIPTLRADAVQLLQGLDEEGSALRDLRRSRSAEGEEEPGAQAATGSRSGSAGEEDAASARAQQRGGGDSGAPPASEAEEDTGSSDASGENLTEEEQKQVKELQARDREVRAHEQAHARVGGAYAGSPSYTFQQGPDKQRYAIGGEVQIDTSAERTPEATARKMQIVIRAALAPAEPSSQDLRVAQQARASLQEAQADMRAQAAEELRGGDEADGDELAPGSGGQQAGEAEAQQDSSASEGSQSSGGRDSGEEDSRRADRASARSAYEQARSLFSAASASQPGLLA
jgi:hypothetical protein